MRWFAMWLILGLFAGGCTRTAPQEEPLLGIWRGDPPIPANVKNDPSMKELVDFIRGSVVLKLSPDHTYSLELLSKRLGKWSKHNRLIEFTETSVRTGFGPLMDSEVGKLDSSGNRAYSALATEDGKSLKLLLGKDRDVQLTR